MEIKIFRLYTFPSVKGTIDLSGIWETVGVKKFGTTAEKWEMIRRFSTSEDAPVGAAEQLPKFIIDEYANHVDRTALFGTATRN